MRKHSKEEQKELIFGMINHPNFDFSLKQKETLFEAVYQSNMRMGYELTTSQDYIKRNPNSRLEYIDISLLKNGEEEFVKGYIELATKDLKDIAKTSATEQIYDKINVGSIVENQVNNYIEPYKGLIRPLMAILVFGLFQFYATIAMLIFMATVDILFMIAKSSKFFNIIEFDVKKEELKF